MFFKYKLLDSLLSLHVYKSYLHLNYALKFNEVHILNLNDAIIEVFEEIFNDLSTIHLYFRLGIEYYSFLPFFIACPHLFFRKKTFQIFKDRPTLNFSKKYLILR